MRVARAREDHRAGRSREKFRPHAARSLLSLFAAVLPFPIPPLTPSFPSPARFPPRPRYSSRGATSCACMRDRLALCDRVAIFPCGRRGSSPRPRGRDPRLPRRSPSSPLSGKTPSSELSAERRRSSVGAGGRERGGGGGENATPPPRGLERATNSGYA